MPPASRWRIPGVNVLAFSNNAAIAGGNVFVLGQTFDNTARRLAGYAVRNGKSKVLIVHDRNVAGEVGKAAIERGVASAGGSVVGVTSYEFSQNGIVQAASGIVSTAKSSGATALFLTADTAGALPLLSQLLVDNGIDRTTTQFIGLTRWDIPPATLALPGVQGGWFAHAGPGSDGPVPRALRRRLRQPAGRPSRALPMTGSRPSGRWRATGPRAVRRSVARAT